MSTNPRVVAQAAERAGLQNLLLDEYAQAVDSYQSAVLELKEAGNASNFKLMESLLRKADAAKETLNHCRDRYQNCCRG